MNHFIHASDDKVNIDPSSTSSTSTSTVSDKSLWYFKAPPKYLGNHGIAYGGELSFSLSGVSGDFDLKNYNSLSNLNAVVLECKICDHGRGITLAYPLSAQSDISLALSSSSSSSSFINNLDFHIGLTETGGWVKDSKSSLIAWSAPSQCDMIQVLSNVSGMYILGDLTTWYETVALDSVMIANTKSRLPLCAQSRPDALTCSC